jgi:ketosteroid isomerase-like protein
VSAEAVEIVRRFWESTEGGESGLLWDALHPEVEVRDFDLPDATEVYRGHDGFRRWVSIWLDAWEESSMGPGEYVDAGDKVLVVFAMKAKGKGSGVELERKDGIVFEVRDGRVARLDYYGNADQALEAAGLPQRA